MCNLTGAIPRSLGRLAELTGLNQQENSLSRSMPSNNGAMATGQPPAACSRWEQLTGSIPRKNEKLAYLQKLNSE
jgi:hypothetical protein